MNKKFSETFYRDPNAFLSLIIYYLLYNTYLSDYIDFKNHIMSKNRYIQSKNIKNFLDTLKSECLKSKNNIAEGTNLYRARIIDVNFKQKYYKDLYQYLLDINSTQLDHVLIDIDGNYQTVYDIIKFVGNAAIGSDKLIKKINDYKRTSPFQGYNKINSGAPQNYLSKEGRLNPAGISYLYTAEKEDTAVYEVKPFIGQEVSVAILKTKKELTVLDLTREFPKVVVPFPFGEEYDIKAEIDSLLDVISQKFKTPNYGDTFEYIPTQYIAEYIKEVLKYDGIRFGAHLKKMKKT